MNNTQPQTQPNESLNNFKKGIGINLIPTLTKEEEVVVQTKSQVNLGAAISLFLLILLSLIVVGFNIFAKVGLNNAKERLFELENDLSTRQDLLSSNSEILRRVTLYKNIESTTYSTKESLEYLQEKARPYGTINEYSIIGGKTFEITGVASNLNNISKLWYILGNDRYIESINLKNVSKTPLEARFEFKGDFKVEEFKKDRDVNNTNNG